MTIVVDLFDYIGICILGFIAIVLVLTYIVSIIGYEFSRLIRWIQERLWKK